jgi:alkylation response protein AidB-like acyl-CoA dehydrogenase
VDQYRAPVDDIAAAMRTAGLRDVLSLSQYAGIDESAVHDVLEGFGKVAAEIIAPTDVIGDREGARLDVATGTVTVPDALGEAYRHYVDGGWQSIAGPVEMGGGGFPTVLGTAVHEMFGSANMALSLNPMLTQSAVELLERWADDGQRAAVLPHLIDGSWSGTMNLTEPDAGSDLGAVRTSATPRGDGTWAISGTKIFITWGEHELAENIIHLVLARTPDAPAGIRGISLFLVPKFLIDGDGRPGERNTVRCLSIEHKLGIHASPTCVLEFSDARGELVGPLLGGMNAMFSMMNPARLSVGVQGVSIAERSFQQARSYAGERRQGQAAGVTGPAPLMEHPDVQRMLLDIATTRDAMRLLTFRTAMDGDLARHHDDPEKRARHQRRVDLLTPLAKAWCTDEGVRIASLALQIHGGMGFVEETGIAQRYRDARIAPIYEGTNGIQAIDLVGRKIGRDGGAAAAELFDDIDGFLSTATGVSELADVARELAATLADARAATAWVVEQSRVDRTLVLSGACSYLELMSLTVAGVLLLRHAIESGSVRAVRRAQFFAVEALRRRPAYERITLGLLALRDGID